MERPVRWSKEMAYEFAAYKLIMWPIGVWPLQSRKNFLNVRILLSSFLEITMITSILTELGQNRAIDLELMIDYVGLTACGILALTKILFVHTHRKDLLTLFACAADDWTSAKNQDYRIIMMRFARRARMVLTIETISSSMVIVSMILTPLFMPRPSNFANSSEPTIVYLPIGSQCRSSRNSTISCDASYIFQSAQLISTAMGNLGIDILMFGIAMHLCGQFTVMAEEIMRFGVDENDPAHYRCTLIDFVKKHSLALDLAVRVKDTLNLILFVQLFLNSSYICLLGIQMILSLNSGDFALLARALVSFMLLMTQLFLYSYLGESLTSKMETIGQAVYLSDWYNASPDVIRDLHFVIARARIPFSITAGSFYNMNLNNFKNILKASASYFSVLQIMITT